MKKNLVKISLIMGIFISSFGNVLAAGQTLPGKIIEISLEHRNGENDIYLKIEASFSSTCGNQSLIALSADTEEKLARLYATVLSARLANSDMKFTVTDTCNVENIAKVFIVTL